MTILVLTTVLLLSPFLAIWFLLAAARGRAIRRETPEQRQRRQRRKRNEDAVVDFFTIQR